MEAIIVLLTYMYVIDAYLTGLKIALDCSTYINQL